jgi:hypothetical protein
LFETVGYKKGMDKTGNFVHNILWLLLKKPSIPFKKFKTPVSALPTLFEKSTVDNFDI